MTENLKKDRPDLFTTHLAHKVSRGETLAAIWSRFGSPLDAALRAEQALRALGGKFHLLKAGEQIQLKVSAERGVIGISRDLGDGRTLLLDSSRTSGYNALLLSTPSEEKERIVSGTITSSLFNAAMQASIPADMVDQMVDLFSDKVEFTRDLQPGDTFTLVFSQKYLADGSALNSGVIKAAALTNRGKMLAAISHAGNDGKNRFYDQSGAVLGNYFLRYPLKFTRISSAFSQSRFHPVLKKKRPHNGVDFAAPIGTAVRSVADGVVEVAGYSSGSGNWVKIRHDQRYSTAYLHLNRIGTGIRKGSRVSRGDMIGSVGMSGLATGPHLHYSLYDRGRYVNPLNSQLPVLSNDKERIPQSVLASTMEILQSEHKKTSLAFNLAPAQNHDS